MRFVYIRRVSMALFLQHPGVSTVSTSVPAPVQIPGQMPQGPVATPVPAASVTVPLPSPQSLQPTVTTQVRIARKF